MPTSTVPPTMPPPFTPFRGPQSLRVRGERATLVWTLATLPLTIIVLGWVFQHQLTWQQLALLVVVAMVYVSFTRGRLLGGGLRVHAGQFGHVFEVVEECAHMLQMPTPHVFVRDDPFVPVVAIGTGDPYSIVISAQYIEHFQPDELRFLIGRELGQIAAGHTRFTSLLSSNGRENAVISVAFGAWLRKIDYTADRVGLVCCGSLAVALRAIAVSSFHAIGRHIDLAAFAEQLEELRAEPSLRIGEWTASTPYATNRIAALQTFARDPLYLVWSRRFAENLARPRSAADMRGATYAGIGRRAWAWAIDMLVIQVINPLAGSLVHIATNPDKLKTLDADPTVSTGFKEFLKHVTVSASVDGNAGPLVFAVYVIVLVALMGQTFGMMVADIRVVRDDRSARVGFMNALGRYVSLIISMIGIVGILSVFRRVQPYEKWSKTRLISGSATVRP